MKILFVMLNPDYMRNFESTLRLLAQRGHQIYIGFNNFKKIRKSDGLEERLSQEIQAITYIRQLLPKYQDTITVLVRCLRGMRDYFRYISPEYKDAHKLRRRMEKRLWVLRYPIVAATRIFYFFTGNSGLKSANRLFRFIDESLPPDKGIANFLKSLSPDILLVTPLVDFDSVQVDYVKSARYLKIPCGLCVHSWDNLTNKGLMRIEPDQVFVWNRIQKEEAVNLHGINPSMVKVAGAQCYDKWFDAGPSTTREDFYEKVGLNKDKPYILYLCSSHFIAENEVSFVRDWIRKLRASGEKGLQGIGILIRPHFQNAGQWQNVDLREFNNVVIWPPKGENPVTDESRANFYDSMYHSVAIVGLNTSAMIEAGILGKPVFTVADPRFQGSQGGTLHFRYLVEGELLYVSNSFQEHLVQLNKIINTENGAYKERIRNFVKDFVRPQGLHVECTPILADAIESLAKIEPLKAKPIPRWSRCLKFSLFPFAFFLDFLVKQNEKREKNR